MVVNAPVLKECGRCKEEKPATLDYFGRGNKPGALQSLCKDCLRAYAKEGRAVQLARQQIPQVAAGAPETLHCSRCDTVKPRTAFADQKGSSTGKQKWCKDCHRDYRIARAALQPAPSADTPPPPLDASTPLPRPTPGDPLFLEVGTYAFSPPFTVIQDDRGRAVVILPVAETDTRTGHTAPMTVEFTQEEWGARRTVTMADIAAGGRVDLFERVAALERDNERLRKELSRERADKEAAMALAEAEARKVAAIRASLG